MAVLAVQSQPTPQLDVLGLQAGVLRSQIGHFRLQMDNLRLKSTQSLEQDFYFRQLLSHSDNLPHFP